MPAVKLLLSSLTRSNFFKKNISMLAKLKNVCKIFCLIRKILKHIVLEN